MRLEKREGGSMHGFAACSVEASRPAQRGITLIELMVTVALVAILASIAIPSYRSYIIRAQRTDATAALLRVHAAQEKYYLQNNSYVITDVAVLGVPALSENGKYGIAVRAGNTNDNQSYVATAVPIAGSGQDRDTKCTQFTIDNVGRRGSAPSDVATCWR